MKNVIVQVEVRLKKPF